jgi:hypothetical protein
LKGVFNIIGFALLWAFLAFATLGFGLLALAALLGYMFVGADARRDKVEAKLNGTLMAGEKVITASIQHRGFALTHRRIAVAITDSRIIIIRPGLFGGFKMSDIQWKDLKDVRIEENVLDSIFGSNLTFEHYNARVGWLGVDGVKNKPAAEIYARAQFEEQAWEEKRRVRAMEEVRAAAGGVVVHTGAPAAAPARTPPAAAPEGNRMVQAIQQAKQLLDSGVISDAEFQEMKSKILAS